MIAPATPFVRDTPRSAALPRGRHGSSYVGSCEDKEPLIWMRRTEEGEEIDQDVGGELDGARGMVDGAYRFTKKDEGTCRGKLLMSYYPLSYSRGARYTSHELCWLLVVSDRQLGPLRTPNHVCCSEPVPKKKSTIASVHSLIFTKGSRLLCLGFSPVSGG